MPGLTEETERFDWWNGDRLARLPLPDAALCLRVLYEDNHLLTVFKPHGLLTQGPAGAEHTLFTIVKEWIRIQHKKPGNVYLGLVHRLDRPVGGVMVFAKTSKAASRLSKQMREKSIRKAYLGIVFGTPSTRERTVQGYLFKRQKDRKMLVYNHEKTGSKFSELRYNFLETDGTRSLLKIIPKTGRRHQIRALMAQIGLPIWGDLKYGKGPRLKGMIGLMAYEIEIDHPVKGHRMVFTSQVPPSWPWPSSHDTII